MTRRMLAVVLLVALILTVGITAYAGEFETYYSVTIPPLGEKEIHSGTKSNDYDYFCISLIGGTASSIIGSSSAGGSMKVYKNQGFAKIYYDGVPAVGNPVKLFAGLTGIAGIAEQTATGYSFCN